MNLKQKKMTYYFLSTLLLVGTITILAYTIPNHIMEIKSMEECANTPGCMFCIPKWVGGRATINYVIASVMFFICIILFLKNKKNNHATNEEVNE